MIEKHCHALVDLHWRCGCVLVLHGHKSPPVPEFIIWPNPKASSELKIYQSKFGIWADKCVDVFVNADHSLFLCGIDKMCFLHVWFVSKALRNLARSMAAHNVMKFCLWPLSVSTLALSPPPQCCLHPATPSLFLCSLSPSMALFFSLHIFPMSLKQFDLAFFFLVDKINS